MLGQPVYFLTPDVVGVHLTGRPRRRRHRDRPRPGRHRDAPPREGRRQVRRVLRRGRRLAPGARTAPPSPTWRPEYGATMGFFPVDEESCRYLLATGRTPRARRDVPQLLHGAGPVRHARAGRLRLHRRRSSSTSRACGRASPGRGGRRTGFALPGPEGPLPRAPREGRSAENGYGKDAAAIAQRFPARPLGRPVAGGGSQAPASARGGRRRATRAPGPRPRWRTTARRPTPRSAGEPPSTERVDVGHGDVLIAAITSCTNTSNPSVMLAAGLLAKKAVERGLIVSPARQDLARARARASSPSTSTETGLQPYLDQLGFNLVGYGCTTCIGNSGPLDSGHREGRHGERPRDRGGALRQPQLRGAHPPEHQGELPDEPAARRRVRAGRPRRHRPDDRAARQRPGRQRRLPARRLAVVDGGPAGAARVGRRRDLPAALRGLRRRRTRSGRRSPRPTGTVYAWDPASTYIQEPPFFEGFSLRAGAACTDIRGARALGDLRRLGHDRPHQPGRRDQGDLAGGPLPAVARRGAGRLQQLRLAARQRPGHDARHVRQRADQEPDGARRRGRRHEPPARRASRWHLRRGDALPEGRRAARDLRRARNTAPGSSRDWAAKGTRLLGVRAVVAQSFERIHRSNLVGMGVLPASVPGGHQRRDPRPRRHGDLRPRGPRRRASRRARRRRCRSAGRTARATESPLSRSDRHADRDRLLPPRRHPAVRPAAAPADDVLPSPLGPALPRRLLRAARSTGRRSG